jgi:hypothetical protein
LPVEEMIAGPFRADRNLADDLSFIASQRKINRTTPY